MTGCDYLAKGFTFEKFTKAMCWKTIPLQTDHFWCYSPSQTWEL